MFVRLGKFLLAVILALLALMLSQSTTLGQAAQAKTQRFGAGWIDIPAGYKFEHVVGPDFDVDYVIPNDVQLNKATTMLGLYTGFAPPFNPPAKGVKIRAGVYHYEALIRLKGGLWVWHLFMAAPDMQRMREVMSILESYRAM